MESLCGIEIVGETMANHPMKVSKYQEYPTLEESTVGEDESLDYNEQPQEEPENTFSRLVVCYLNPSDATNGGGVTSPRTYKEAYHDDYERPNRWDASSALCSSGVSSVGVCPAASNHHDYAPTTARYSVTHRLSTHNTRDILERSGSKLMLYPEDYPEDAPNLLEDCDFEILAPQDTLDEGQAEEVQVLNPDIMEDLQSHLPLSKKGESFWLQYSLIRDGASMDSLLYKIRNTDHCVLAIETVDGDVFGAYTTKRWRYHDDFFGHRDAFLWRKNPDPKEGEEDVQCYHFSHLNQDVQLCTHDRLAVGGGIRKLDPEYGFGISLDRDLLTGTTSKSMTFLNPPLSSKHADGSTFEVRNIEVWALTPCLSLEDAERIAERVTDNPIWA